MSDAKDLWLLGIERGKQDERERIIKMLEALMQTRPTEETIRWGGFSIERLIELIKGEQK
jgi:hypothetical protein